MKHYATKARYLWNVEQAQTLTKLIMRSLFIIIPTVLAAVAILRGAQVIAPILSFYIIFALFILAVSSLVKNPKRLANLPCWIWNRPICLAIATLTAITVMTGATFAIHIHQLSKVITSPVYGEPWREDLTVRAYWHKPASQDAHSGLADTVRILGFEHETVETLAEANLHVWPDSWAQSCKWPSTIAFASLDPNPSSKGSQTGDIHICRFTTPFKKHPSSDYSIVAHEAAHILAAQLHFGEGLMAEAGGNGSPWFTQEEIRAMCDKINDFHRSVEIAEPSPTGQDGPMAYDKSTGNTSCGITHQSRRNHGAPAATPTMPPITQLTTYGPSSHHSSETWQKAPMAGNHLKSPFM